MSSYYTASSNPQETAPMLYLRDNFPGSYPDTPVLSNNMMLYMNSGSYSDTLATNSQQQNSGIQIPSVAASDSTPQQQEILSGLGGSRIGVHGLNEWRDARNELSVMHSISASSDVLQNGQSFQGQGLSLTLGTQIPSRIQVPSVEYQNGNPSYTTFLSSNPTMACEGGSRSGFLREDQSRNVEYFHSNLSMSNVDSNKEGLSVYGVASVSRTIPNSKYLKAAQQLLEEVVNVSKALKTHSEKNPSANAGKKGSVEIDGGSEKGKDKTCSNSHELTSNSLKELSQAERQDLQNKLTKLLHMYDEVERRYKQYYHHMQIVVSSFDVIAGCGAAKPYTALALQTISRHFRCLRDAIDQQIQSTRKSLGEQDDSGTGKGVGITRLRYVDQQLRQQRALQQLGIGQHTWRPQRGLPESSVSILRAWLFEHFLHPYPKDSDKIMLARQTGLSRSQVSNWFINARVRLWKPMVEEMYKEETGDANIESNSSSENTAKATKNDDEKGEDQQRSTSSVAAEGVRQSLDPKLAHTADVEMMGPTEGSGLSNDTNRGAEIGYGPLKLRDRQRPHVDGYMLPSESVVQPDGDNSGFMPAASVYQMSEFGRIGSSSGVSLTLGLQHCEGRSLPGSSNNQNDYMSSRGHVFYSTAATAAAAGGGSVPVESSDFECISGGNRQARFGSNHLLHDFVA